MLNCPRCDGMSGLTCRLCGATGEITMARWQSYELSHRIEVALRGKGWSAATAALRLGLSVTELRAVRDGYGPLVVTERVARVLGITVLPT